MLAPSYHDLFITTAAISRKSIFNLPFSVRVTCTRVGGWEVWFDRGGGVEPTLIAGEYHGGGLILDVAGHVIVDSLTNNQQAP